jgi:hypothetical protein
MRNALKMLVIAVCWFLGGTAMWIDLIDTMMHIEGQGEGGGSRVLAAMWLPSWQRAAAKIGATPKLQHSHGKSMKQSSARPTLRHPIDTYIYNAPTP